MFLLRGETKKLTPPLPKASQHIQQSSLDSGFRTSEAYGGLHADVLLSSVRVGETQRCDKACHFAKTLLQTIKTKEVCIIADIAIHYAQTFSWRCGILYVSHGIVPLMHVLWSRQVWGRRASCSTYLSVSMQCAPAAVLATAILNN